MRWKTLRCVSIALMLAMLGLGCATTNPYKMPREEFFQKVHKLAFTPVEFNVEVGTAAKREKQDLAQKLIQEHLATLGRFELIPPEQCEKIQSEALAELKIDGFFDPKTGQLDQGKFAAFSKYFMQKIGADGWLYVSYVPGVVAQKFKERRLTGEYEVTRMAPAVDLYAKISDPSVNTLWESSSLVGAELERTSCIPGLSFLGTRDKQYTSEQVMTDAKVSKAVKKAFASLK